MTTTTETEIKELKDFIKNQFDELKTEIKDVRTETTKLSERIRNLEIGQAKIEERLEALQENWTPFFQKIPDFAEKVGESKNWRQVVFLLFGGAMGGLVTWFFWR